MTTTMIPNKAETVGEYEYRVSNGTYFRGCTRCGGTGHYSFNGIDSDCYLCNNNPVGKLGVMVGTLADAEKDAAKRLKARNARAAKREQERLAALAKRDAAWEEFKAVEPEMFAFLHNIATSEEYDRSSFINDMASKLWSLDTKPFSEKMIAAVKREIEKRAERVANAVPLAFTGTRGQLTGEIISVKYVENDFGSAYKIVLKDDRGFRVYGTLPSNLVAQFIDEFNDWVDAKGGSVYNYGHSVWALGSDNETIDYRDNKGIVGKRISFMARVEASDDIDFGFYSRPTKAEAI